MRFTTIGFTAALAACSGSTAVTPAQIQTDLATARAALQAAGCAAVVASAAAAPIIAVSSDAKGQTLLAATTASGAVLCQMPAPVAIASPPGTVLTAAPATAAPAPVAPAS
jgi:hypothetical protein